MRGLFIASTMAAGALILQPLAAHATALVAIDLTHQRMHVSSNEGSFDWPISSARSGFHTPGGSFAPQRLERMHYSHLYHMSPMPYAIFFAGGYAIHGTYATGALGQPASHGCVRLSPGNAAALFSMVQHEGARISISGTPPASPRLYEARRRSRSPSYADAGDGQGGYGYDDRSYARARPAAYGAAYGYGMPPYGYAVQPYGYGYGASPF